MTSCINFNTYVQAMLVDYLILRLKNPITLYFESHARLCNFLPISPHQNMGRIKKWSAGHVIRYLIKKNVNFKQE